MLLLIPVQRSILEKKRGISLSLGSHLNEDRLVQELNAVFPAYVEALTSGRSIEEVKARKEAIEARLEQLNKQMFAPAVVPKSYGTTSDLSAHRPNNGAHSAYLNASDGGYPTIMSTSYNAGNSYVTSRNSIDIYNAADFSGDYINQPPDDFAASGNSPLCHCQLPAVEKVARTDANMNRSFFCCPKNQGDPGSFYDAVFCVLRYLFRSL